MASSCSALMARGRPPCFPRRLAAANPAVIRSWVKARSYCASAPKRLNRKAPCGVVVSICSVRERNATPWALEGEDNLQEMRERAAQAVQFPDDQAIAGVHIGEGLLEPRAIVPRAAGLVGKQLPGIHAGREQGIALQVGRLTIGLTGDPHIADEHRRKTPRCTFSYILAIRWCFSHRL